HFWTSRARSVDRAPHILDCGLAGMTYTILVVVQVLVALTLVGLILVHHGKGADAGAAFGSGASGTVFGAQGSANFLSRATAVLAAVFFAVSLALAYLINTDTGPTTESVTSQLQQQPAAQTAPARSDDTSTGETSSAATPAATNESSDEQEQQDTQEQSADQGGVTGHIPE